MCLDDNHMIKIGEPGFPVQAAEHGRHVLVSKAVPLKLVLTILS